MKAAHSSETLVTFRIQNTGLVCKHYIAQSTIRIGIPELIESCSCEVLEEQSLSREQIQNDSSTVTL
jgi:predicted nucleotide-binding protein (sugar kinase/HSP70/actin superfamily)